MSRAKRAGQRKSTLKNLYSLEITAVSVGVVSFRPFRNPLNNFYLYIIGLNYHGQQFSYLGLVFKKVRDDPRPANINMKLPTSHKVVLGPKNHTARPTILQHIQRSLQKVMGAKVRQYNHDHDILVKFYCNYK